LRLNLRGYALPYSSTCLRAAARLPPLLLRTGSQNMREGVFCLLLP